MKKTVAISLAFIVFAAIFIWLGPTFPKSSTMSATFTATATGVEVDTPVEFLFVGPHSDRDYEAVFIVDETPAEIAKAVEKGGIPVGKPIDEILCRFWPSGRRVSISPDPWQYVRDKEPGDGHLPIVYTGGQRDSSGMPVANTNMPESVLALYSLGQSLFLLDDALDQSVVYGRFLASQKLEKGTKVRFTVSWDGVSGTTPYALSIVPGNIKEGLEAMRAAACEGGLDVTPSFSPDLTLAEATAAAQALSVLDSRQVRIDGFEAGQFFFRAFLPLEKWRDRKERLTQPLEVVLSESSAVFTVIDEDWNVEGLDPKLTQRNVSLDEARLAKTDTCIVYASADTRLQRLYELRKELPAFRNWYFFPE